MLVFTKNIDLYMEVHSRVPVVIKFCIFHVETSEIILTNLNLNFLLNFECSILLTFLDYLINNYSECNFFLCVCVWK